MNTVTSSPPPASTFHPIFILFLRPQTGNLHLLFLRFPTLMLSILFWRCVVTLSIVLGGLLVLLLLAYLVYALLKAEEF
ncbi:putative membrane protein [Pectobacterium atrosepticum SCRI1043]|uniref:Membrane protein n=1 Tax=Pectobacterium atrosepticum (strain SCRI 1043 / ATCC BAA-672) TaxID=218491 RepID=Q6D7I2_PECAS|nr:putative membrane protein [Pectobacterium atrosepticum SCRI1043]